MMFKDPFVMVILVVLSGCAAYELPPLSTSHPANPQAAKATEPPKSKTLVYSRADIPSARPLDAAIPQGMDQMRDGAQKTVTGEGKVVATVPNSSQIVVDHGEIKGFMGAMTMGYRVEPPSQLQGLKSGDRIRFTIDVPKKTIIKIETLK